MFSLIKTEVTNYTETRFNRLLGGNLRLWLQPHGELGDSTTINGDVFTLIEHQPTAYIIKDLVESGRLRLKYFINDKLAFDSFGEVEEDEEVVVGDTEITVTEPENTDAITVENAEETYVAPVVDEPVQEVKEEVIDEHVVGEATIEEKVAAETVEVVEPTPVAEESPVVSETQVVEEAPVEEETKPKKTRSKKIKLD